MKDEYLTTEDIANKLKVTSVTVTRWIESGKLRAFRMDRIIRISNDDFMDFLQSNSR